MSRMISQYHPKKPVVRKERLTVEQLRMTEELYRQIDVLYDELEVGLDKEERNIAMDEWSNYRRSFRECKTKARALINGKPAFDVDVTKFLGRVRDQCSPENRRSRWSEVDIPAECRLPGNGSKDQGAPWQTSYRSQLLFNLIGKDPRTSELIPSDCLITLVRELLSDLTKIKWDEMTMDNESSQYD
ncbi:hypothetical protein T4B_11937 [Trichinella pseudospiralis]|uniref:Uncharacterized protein n=1 Tax=Trichinella pseudospiralis TaxID=6337 RepID=A0A0V1JZZ7_TRIPS|nr:hypothetical protein T4B_11937 [Trichinella pseudospiralis]KRZ40101.1 hypothetical protein T4C_3427 [Trichinella pseudospiralis]